MSEDLRVQDMEGRDVMRRIGNAGLAAAVVAAALAMAAGGAAGAAGAPAEKGKPHAGRLSPRLHAVAAPAALSASAGAQAAAAGLPATGAGSLLRDRVGNILVEVRTASTVAETVAELTGVGARIVEVTPDLDLVTAAVAPERLARIGQLRSVHYADEVLTPLRSSETGVTHPTTCDTARSEGDIQLKAKAARTQFGVSGRGVKVGVLSDSYNKWAGAATRAPGDVRSGDLPGTANPCAHKTNVQVLDDSASGLDEGRAMAQIVHDLAPDAAIAVHTAFVSSAGFAQGIIDLKNAGAEITVDDVTYFDEPFFQDGPIANAVNAVTAAGVTHFSSAANSNIIVGGRNVSSFEAAAFRPTSCPSGGLPSYVRTCMDFHPGAAADPTYTIQLANGGTFRADVQWAEPWFGVKTDIDVYLLDQAGNVVAQSEAVNPSATKKPFEFVAFQNTTGSTRTYHVVFSRYAGTATPRIKLVMVGTRGLSGVEYSASAGTNVVGPTIFGHNGAAGAVSTAAVAYNGSTTVQPYSSRGPVTHYFGKVNGTTPAPKLAAPRVLAKPDITATDGGRNTFFLPPDNRFFGTSAAAPHAAAVAALMKEKKPSATPAQIKAALFGTAAPMNGGQHTSGAGRVDALAAVGALTAP